MTPIARMILMTTASATIDAGGQEITIDIDT